MIFPRCFKENHQIWQRTQKVLQISEHTKITDHLSHLPFSPTRLRSEFLSDRTLLRFGKPKDYARADGVDCCVITQTKVFSLVSTYIALKQWLC